MDHCGNEWVVPLVKLCGKAWVSQYIMFALWSGIYSLITSLRGLATYVYILRTCIVVTKGGTQEIVEGGLFWGVGVWIIFQNMEWGFLKPPYPCTWVHLHIIDACLYSF